MSLDCRGSSMSFDPGNEGSGGPDWAVKLGRKDSLMASQEDSDNIMPSPRANASYLVNLFHRLNLSVKDLVALSGSHSIGECRCFSIVFQLYNQSGSGKPDLEMDPTYREKLDRLCPITGDQNVTRGLDTTPTLFDNQNFKDLLLKKGFLNSDQTLHKFEETRVWVEKFSENQGAFFEAFGRGDGEDGRSAIRFEIETREDKRAGHRDNFRKRKRDCVVRVIGPNERSWVPETRPQDFSELPGNSDGLKKAATADGFEATFMLILERIDGQH
ncbi:Peroxidase 17-like protein [Drosera capensis]